jgi:hypothetical protein
MGETIEQYRARIGVHNNIRMRSCSSSLAGKYSDIMVFMLFHLVFTIMILFCQVLYLSISVLYLLDFPKSFPGPSMARFTSSVERTFVTFSAPNITGGKIHR